MAKNKIKNKKHHKNTQATILSKEPNIFMVISILMFGVLAIYFQSINNPIVFDTAQNFNDHVLNNYFDNFSVLNLRSFSSFTFGLFYKLIEADWAYHRSLNIILQITNACLIFLVLKKLFKEVLKEQYDQGPLHMAWVAFLAAIFFAIHPMGVYATAYLIQRSIQMAVMFCLISTLLYIKGVVENKWEFLLMAVIAYFFAMHSKEHCVMFPAVLFMITLMLDPFSFKKYLFKYSWVFILCAIIALQLILLVKGIIGVVYEPHGKGMIGSANVKQAVFSEEKAFPLSVFTQSHMFFRYIYLWLIPNPNNIYIDVHLPFATKFTSWPESFTIICFTLYPILSLWLVFKKGVRALLGFGLISVWLLFLTEVTVVRLSEQFVIYRSYLWVVAIGAVLPALFSLKINNKYYPKIKMFVGLSYLLAISIVAYGRVATFDSKVSVWTDVVKKIRGKENNEALYKSYRPFNNLAFALTASGKLVESIPYYYEAIRINPDYVKARSNLGAVLTNQRRYQEAIEHFRHAINKDPKYIDAHVGLGVCAAEQGNQEEAIQHYKNALKVKDDYPDANFNMGNAYLKLRNYNNAIKYYKVAISSKPNFADSHHNLGIAFSNINRILDAKKAFEKALEVNPEHKRSREALNIINSRMFNKRPNPQLQTQTQPKPET
ncbi:hypothetical protein BVY03_01595 [bacterium K02(2017)]|nr:hypothetical protein BVY03_01595 [bacterium K02(2017)]